MSTEETVAVEVTADEKTETKEVKGTKRAAEVSIRSWGIISSIACKWGENEGKNYWLATP